MSRNLFTAYKEAYRKVAGHIDEKNWGY